MLNFLDGFFSPSSGITTNKTIPATLPHCAQDLTPDQNPKMSTRCRIAWMGSLLVLNPW